MLGDFYLSNGDTQKALAEFASLAKAHPKDLRVKKTYIQLLILANRGADAKSLNDEILKANPKDTDAQILRAELLSHDGRANRSPGHSSGCHQERSGQCRGSFPIGPDFRGDGQHAAGRRGMAHRRPAGAFIR